MADRVHVFGGNNHLMQSRDIVRRMASCLTGADVTAEESLASTYDHVLGGSDLYVGCNMTYLVECSSGDPRGREYVERTLAAVDLLRQSRRTAH